MIQLKKVFFATARALCFLGAVLILIWVYKALLKTVVPIELLGAPYWPIAENFGAAVLIAFFYWIVVRAYRKEGRERTGFAPTGSWLRHYALGCGSGAILVTVLWSVLVAIEGLQVKISPFSLPRLISLGVYIPQIALYSFWQELVYRGLGAFVCRKAGRVYAAALISVFYTMMASVAAFRDFEVTFKSMAFPALVSIYLFSLICFELTWVTGSLWSSAGFHGAFYGFSRVLYGISLDGEESAGLLTSQTGKIGDILTGGGHGLLASYICVILLAIGFLFLWILYRNPNKADEPLADWMMDGEWLATAE